MINDETAVSLYTTGIGFSHFYIYFLSVELFASFCSHLVRQVLVCLLEYVDFTHFYRATTVKIIVAEVR